MNGPDGQPRVVAFRYRFLILNNSPMKIMVIGASGRVGSKLTHRLLEKQHTVLGTTRQEEPLFDDANYRQVHLDLTADPAQIEDLIPADLDAIYFVSGSRGKDLLQTDLDGAVKTMQAAEKKKISRYIMLSSAYSLQPDAWNEDGASDLKDYLVAKHYADRWLIDNTGLDYTILQPGALKEEAGSGRIDVNISEPGENAIENVADTLLAILDHPGTARQVIPMQDGDTPIAQAIAAL